MKKKLLSIILVCITISTTLSAQDQEDGDIIAPQPTAANATKNLEISLNILKTDLKNTAIGFAVQYLKPLDGIEYQLNARRGFLTITPEVSIQEGTSDAFSQIVLKASGFFLTASMKPISEDLPAPVPDPTKVLHIFPYALGVETSSDFHFVNTIAELGYVPYYQSEVNPNVNDFFRRTQIGFFIQGGYKGLLDSANIPLGIGGKKDESEEKVNSGLLRGKIMGAIDTKNFFKKGDAGFGLVGKGTYWYDMLNSAHYYQIDVRMRIYFAKDKYLDLVYQKGSGAPNFNTGDQFGTALTFRL